jgi:Ca2+-binding RTX toxin-like protein
VLGEAGADLIYGGAGDDLVDGGSGNDTIWLGDGEDEMPDREDGFDLGPDFELSSAGNDQVTGGAGDDFLIDWLGSDTLRGDLGDDLIVGIDNDGTTAPDRLEGGWGSDYIVGDDGDTISGGGGSFDEYNLVLNERDDAAVMITDFDSATEHLFLSVDEQAFAGATGDDLTMQIDPASGDVTLFLQGQKVAQLIDAANGFKPGSVFLPEWMRPVA